MTYVTIGENCNNNSNRIHIARLKIEDSDFRSHIRFLVRKNDCKNNLIFYCDNVSLIRGNYKNNISHIHIAHLKLKNNRFPVAD